MNPRVIAKGPINPEDIDIEVTTTSNRKTTPEIENQIQSAWEIIQSKAKERGQQCYDGESLRADEIIIENGKVQIIVSPIRFSQRKPLIDLYESLPSEEYGSKGLCVICLIKTNDGKFVFFCRSNKSFTRERIDLAGGIVEKADYSNGICLLEKSKNEVYEEAGITESIIEDMKILGIISVYNSNVIVVTSIKLSTDSAHIVGIFETRPDNEMFRPIFIEEKNLKNYMHELGGYMDTVVELLES